MYKISAARHPAAFNGCVGSGSALDDSILRLVGVVVARRVSLKSQNENISTHRLYGEGCHRKSICRDAARTHLRTHLVAFEMLMRLLAFCVKQIASKSIRVAAFCHYQPTIT